MTITTNQLYHLLMVLSDISQKELSKRLGINYSTLVQKLKKQKNFSFIKQVFKATDIPFSIYWDEWKIDDFSLSHIGTAKEIAARTGLNFQLVERAIKNDKIKFEHLLLIFKKYGNRFHIIINNSIFYIK